MGKTPLPDPCSSSILGGSARIQREQSRVAKAGGIGQHNTCTCSSQSMVPDARPTRRSVNVGRQTVLWLTPRAARLAPTPGCARVGPGELSKKHAIALVSSRSAKAARRYAGSGNHQALPLAMQRATMASRRCIERLQVWWLSTRARPASPRRRRSPGAPMRQRIERA